MRIHLGAHDLLRVLDAQAQGLARTFAMRALAIKFGVLAVLVHAGAGVTVVGGRGLSLRLLVLDLNQVPLLGTPSAGLEHQRVGLDPIRSAHGGGVAVLNAVLGGGEVDPGHLVVAADERLQGVLLHLDSVVGFLLTPVHVHDGVLFGEGGDFKEGDVVGPLA